jgi:glycosyltransferase involved in cell wall biosynthesis
MEWSDQTYLKRVKETIATRHMESIVQILGTVSDELMQDLYHKSHIFTIPSYHEGFCKPVIEGLRAGCIPVGYAAHNLPAISNGLGRMVPTGGIAALSTALEEVIVGVAQSLGKPEDPALPLDRGQTSARAFDRIVSEYVQAFTFDRLASVTLERIRTLRPVS